VRLSPRELALRLAGLAGRNREFARYWSAQAVSIVGTQVTTIALPLAASLGLGASASTVGALGATQWAPFVFLGLPAGVWVDRLDRRRVMIACDVGRSLALCVVVAMALLDALTIASLFAAALTVGVFHVFHAIASRAIIPSIVERADLVEANSKLELTNSAGRLAGPALGGALVGWIRAAPALAADAASYALAAFFTWRMGGSHRAERSDRPSFAAELKQGIQYVVQSPIQRSLVLALMIANLASGALFVSGAHVMFGAETLGLDVGAYGAIVGLGSLGAAVGSLAARKVASLIGEGVMIVSAFGLFGAVLFGMSLLSADSSMTGAALFALQLGMTCAFAAGSIGIATIVQTVTPKSLLGRVGGVGRFATWGILPFGSILGGALADAYSLTGIFRLSAAFVATAALLLLAGPLRTYVAHKVADH